MKIVPFKSYLASFLCGLLVIAVLYLAPVAADAAQVDQELHKAVQLLEEQDYASAIDLLKSIESRIINPEKISGLLAQAYLGSGFQHLSGNDFAGAIAAFREGRHYNEREIQLWQGEAIALYRQGHYAECASLLEEALAISPQAPGTYHLLGQAYYADGRMAQAVDALAKAVEFGGGDKDKELLAKVRREWQVEREMGREVRGNFQLSFVDGTHTSDLAAEIVDVLEEAYTELGSDLNYYPDVVVPVLLYSLRDFSSITNSPDWAGGVYDGKIRLPLGGVQTMSDALAAVLYHEYMHVLVHFMANRNVPVWLNEGLAELAGRRIYSPELRHLQAAVAERRLLDWKDLEKPFTRLPHEDVLLAYEQSYSLVRFMVENYGWYKMTELLKRLGQKEGWQEALAGSYSDYGLYWSTILKDWQASVGYR